MPHLLPLGPSTGWSLAQPVWVSALALSRCRAREPQAWLRSLDPTSPPQSCRGLSLEVCGVTRSPTPELRALQPHHQHLGLQAGNPVAAATSWGVAVPPPARAQDRASSSPSTALKNPEELHGAGRLTKGNEAGPGRDPRLTRGGLCALRLGLEALGPQLHSRAHPFLRDGVKV